MKNCVGKICNAVSSESDGLLMIVDILIVSIQLTASPGRVPRSFTPPSSQMTAWNPVFPNNHSEAVGTSFDAAGDMHPFVWRNGVMTNLNAFMSPGSPWLILEALGNNDRGQIIGFAMNNSTGEVHGYVPTPCGENESANCDDGPPMLSVPLLLTPRGPVPAAIQRRVNRFHALPFLLEQENLP
jgi:hypothetical protein